MLYTIGEMAKTVGVPASTLRFYERKGLLPFVQRSSGGIRMFTDADYEAIKVIECLKASGMPLKDIEAFIRMTQQGDASIDERLQLFQKRKAELADQIAALQRTMEVVEYKCWYYETAKQAGTTAIHEGADALEVPEHLRAAKARLSVESEERKA